MTISDHNAILFSILPHRTRTAQPYHSDLRFNIRRSNWECFDEELRRVASSSFKGKLSSLPPQQAASLLTKTLQEVCRRTFGTKRTLCRSVPWWNARLSELRRKTQSARRQLGRNRRLGNTDEINQARNIYKKIRAEYVKEIRRSKMSSWQNLVTVKGNEDPWGIVYKILKNKIRSDFNTFHAVGDGDASTITWRDTAMRLLDRMVPTDSEHDDANMRIIVNRVDNYSNFNLEPLISEEEVDSAIKRVRNNKASGLDGLNLEIIKQLWRVDKEVVLILFNCL